MDKTTALSRVMDQEILDYENRYGQYFESVEAEFKDRYGDKRDFTSFDKGALGKYLKNWESFIPVFESDATTQDSLGPILKVGLDLVALQYATLPIQFLASVQPLTDEAGMVYYRKSVATAARGGIAVDEVLIDYMGKANPDIDSYMSEEQVDTTQTITSGPSVGPYTYNTPALLHPVRPKMTTIDVGGGKIRGFDDGENHILGVGIDVENSSIDYGTGVLVVKFTNLAGHGVIQGDQITVVYSQDITQASVIPGFKYDVTGKVIRVKYYLLQSQYTSLANYVVRRRFGKSLAEDVARDTVAQVNGAVLYNAIKRLYVAAVKNETAHSYSAPTWPLHPDAGVSDIDHRRTFTDILESASSIIENMSGRSTLSFMVISQGGRKIMTAIGFNGERKQVPGPYLAGFFEGIPVFYAPATLIPANDIIFGFRGLMWYESPLVYAPFLPTTLVKSTGIPNVFVDTFGVATGCGLEMIVPEFVCRGTLV